MSANDRLSPARDPEALLRRIEAADQQRAGQLKIFLGYASGVGKSFRLFDEGRRRRKRGEDVVVAAVQPDPAPRGCGDSSTASKSFRTHEVAGVPVIDVPAVLARHPQFCLVDGLAYDNPPGSRHSKRYEDVEELLEAGISVVTSINLEYIAEQQDFVEQVLGRTKQETVPQDFINRADEVVVVDAPPEAATAIESASALAASPARAAAHGRCRRPAARGVSAAARHPIVVGHAGADPRVHDAAGERRQDAGQRPAQRRPLPRRAVRDLRDAAQPDVRGSHGARAQRHAGARAAGQRRDPGRAGIPSGPFSNTRRSHGITQIFVGHNLRRTWRARLGGTPLDRLIRDAEGMDVRVFPQ